jgi:AraC family transcriptional regulator
LIRPRDSIIERLAHTLLSAKDVGSSLGQMYLESVTIAIIARLLSRPEAFETYRRRETTELARWRLKHVFNFIEDHIAEPVTLSDMAKSVGLSRMYFAGQFKAGTGLRPHEYLLRRRIERAQHLLIETRCSVAEIALMVGLQSQSHFTSVFTNLSESRRALGSK